ncbi:hypothetical protein DFH07DRAFT_1018823 [Mycena maculata]|uniref:TPR-like protein n=1 Tax=Mycena maculata TaxID=230809 RepID=A0AAD7H650_9AGAR|nr:hypothetical protein DFH07DRAFT_1018823 [Mycena maculata]
MTRSCGILTLLASSSSNSNRSGPRLSGAAFDICLELLLLSISAFLHEFHGAKPSMRPENHQGAPRVRCLHPRNFNLSDSMLLGAAFSNHLEPSIARREGANARARRHPSHAKVLQQLGWLYHQDGSSFQNQDLAIQYLTKSLEADPSDAQSWYLLGRAYMAGQKYNKAYEAYQQAVYRDGRNPTFWCSISVLTVTRSTCIPRAIRINPYISEVWFDLGSLYESCNNQISDAIDAYARASELDPSNPVISQRLALLKNAQATGGQRPVFRTDSRGPPSEISLPPPSQVGAGRSSPGPFRGGPPPPIILDEKPAPPPSRPPAADSRGRDPQRAPAPPRVVLYAPPAFGVHVPALPQQPHPLAAAPIPAVPLFVARAAKWSRPTPALAAYLPRARTNPHGRASRDGLGAPPAAGGAWARLGPARAPRAPPAAFWLGQRVPRPHAAVAVAASGWLLTPRVPLARITAAARPSRPRARRTPHTSRPRAIGRRSHPARCPPSCRPRTRALPPAAHAEHSRRYDPRYDSGRDRRDSYESERSDSRGTTRPTRPCSSTAPGMAEASSRSHAQHLSAQRLSNDSAHRPPSSPHRPLMSPTTALMSPTTTTVEDAVLAPPSASDCRGAFYGFRIAKMRATPAIVKLGRAKEPRKRRAQWAHQCRGERHRWLTYYWEVPFYKKFEKIIHCHYKAAGAWVVPDRCRFCTVRHQEKFGLKACGGVRGLVRVVEYYLGRLNWPVISKYFQKETVDTTIDVLKPRDACNAEDSGIGSNLRIEAPSIPTSNPASNPSTENTLNGIVLTPDDAVERTLPHHFVPELAGALEGVHAAQAQAQAEHEQKRRRSP